jgi:hypothetical protein
MVGPVRQILELRTLPGNQETRRSIVEAGELKLPDRAGEFADLRAQFQNPERKGIITHARPAPMRRSLFST